MSKTSIKFYISIILSILLMSSNSIAFHKEGNSEKVIILSEGITKKDIQSEYCTFQVKKYSKPSQTKKKEEEITEKKSKKQKNETVEEQLYKVNSYHAKETKDAPKELDFSILKNKINKNTYIGAVSTIEELLNYYCVQEKSLEDKIKIYKKGDEKLYDEIAINNGYSGRNATIEGPIYDTGKINLTIEGKTLIYSKAQFILNEEERLKIKAKKDEAKKKAEEKKKKKKQARNEAIKKGKEQWISENKQNYIEQFIIKNDEYLKLIQNLKDNRNKLNERVKNYEKLTEESIEEIEIAFDDLANIDQQIKDKKREIRDNKKEYLSKVILESFEDRLKKINSINFEKYDNYLRLKKIIKKAKKSKSPVDFLGKEGFKIPLPNIAGGGTYKIGSDKIGFIEEFENIKKKSLGSGSKTDFKNMRELSEEIIEKKNEINVFIIKPVKELVAYDNLLEEEKAKTPWGTYALFLLIFLIIIAAIIGLIFYLKKTKEDLKEEAEQKVGSLKSEFDNKLRNTSDQIKLANRDPIRLQQSSVESNQLKPTQERPKTHEQIITEKYDQLVSDYKDALDDFSKVAEFKEKWQGLALTRKERQDGTKTILINSTRAFEKAEIWCVTFSEKYFAFPGSSVKFNMATYMNLDFEKAGRDFKGVFSISSGSNYSTEPSVLRRGGAGFVVERAGKIIFPN